MKALLVAIFRAMQRRKLGQPSAPASVTGLKTTNVVQMDRRENTSPTGRRVSQNPVIHNFPPTGEAKRMADMQRANIIGADLYELEQRMFLSRLKRASNEKVNKANVSKEDDYDWARRSCESAWPQPSYFPAPDPTPVQEPEKTVAAFSGSGGSFDGGGSSGDWSSSSSSDSGSSSCSDSGSSSCGMD